MAKLVSVYNEGEPMKWERRQLPIVGDDNKIMVMQLTDSCEGCEHQQGTNSRDFKSFEMFNKQYNMLGKEEVVAALMVPSKLFFNRLAQAVGCVGCRRSVERLYNQLKNSGQPAIEPLTITPGGVITVLRKYAHQPVVLGSLFVNIGLTLNELLDNIPKLKKSGRCVIHSMEGVRCRAGSRAWLEVWENMSSSCRSAITLIGFDQLLVTLDNYLQKHRFCQECKNKVHRAYDILIGSVNVDASNSKDKGSPTLYSGIKRCTAKRHIHVASDTDYIMHLITRAEPELQGRRERHAKTLEIAQEEVLTCLGLFLHERLQRLHSKMKEEQQTWYILYHIGLDTLSNNFDMAIEKKQGFSNFEKLCEEIQKEELREKAKKERKKKKRKNKKNEEGKENSCAQCEEETSCRDCEINMASLNNNSNHRINVQTNSIEKRSENDCFCDDLHCPQTCTLGSTRANSRDRGRASVEAIVDKETCSSPSPDSFHRDRYVMGDSPTRLECSASMDSLVSRYSQGSRDGGYCSAHCSAGSSRDSSEVACGEGLCSHPDDHREEVAVSCETENCNSPSSPLRRQSLPFTLSLEKMLEEPCHEEEEIPEAELRAWRARLGTIREKRVELRQTLRQRFQQLCHRKTGVGNGSASASTSPFLCH